MCAETISLLRGHSPDGCSSLLYHLPDNVYIVLADLILGVICSTIFICGIQRAIASWCVVSRGSQYRTFASREVQPCRNHNFTVLMWGSEVANIKTEVHIAKYN